MNVHSSLKLLNINFGNRKEQTKSETRILAVGGMILHTVANLQTYDVSAVACSGSVQALYLDPLSHFQRVEKIYHMLCKYNVSVWSFRVPLL